VIAATGARAQEAAPGDQHRHQTATPDQPITSRGQITPSGTLSMIVRRSILAASAVMMITGGGLSAALAQQHSEMGMHGSAMQSAMERMQQGMSMPMSGDPDVDFASMMIPHHQGAIDMAKVELEYGKNPELRKLADEIIRSQQAEVGFLQKWLDTHGSK
jgi:uncharacterized protein (DUF305 family)